jgi:SAM-dependent methyltransferase
MWRIHKPTQTPWSQGAFRAVSQRLTFGQTYEDPEIELRSIPPRSRVLCIAGAGTTAQALAAAGHRVTAIDISPAQLDYAQARNVGNPPRAGMAERVLWFGRHLAAMCGWTCRKLDVFLNLSCPSEQIEYWDRELDTPIWRAMFDTLLASALLRLFYRGPFLASLPFEFGPRVRQRLRSGWGSHSNLCNPYASLLLQGRPIVPQTRHLPIRFVCADAAEFLESCAPGSFDAFALSNIGDGAPLEYHRRLCAAVERAGAPRATVVWRSFAEPRSGLVTNMASMDRSLLWGTVGICHLDAVRNGGGLCCIF